MNTQNGDVPENLFVLQHVRTAAANVFLSYGCNGGCLGDPVNVQECRQSHANLDCDREIGQHAAAFPSSAGSIYCVRPAPHSVPPQVPPTTSGSTSEPIVDDFCHGGLLGRFLWVNGTIPIESPALHELRQKRSVRSRTKIGDRSLWSRLGYDYQWMQRVGFGAGFKNARAMQAFGEEFHYTNRRGTPLVKVPSTARFRLIGGGVMSRSSESKIL